MTITWTPDMLQRLHEMRAEGEPLEVCADKVGVCYETTLRKAKEIGISQRISRGPRSGRKIVTDRLAASG